LQQKKEEKRLGKYWKKQKKQKRNLSVSNKREEIV